MRGELGQRAVGPGVDREVRRERRRVEFIWPGSVSTFGSASRLAWGGEAVCIPVMGTGAVEELQQEGWCLVPPQLGCAHGNGCPGKLG